MDMALVVGLDMDMMVVVDHIVVGVGSVLGIVSHLDPHSMMYLTHHSMGLPLDKLKQWLVPLLLS